MSFNFKMKPETIKRRSIKRKKEIKERIINLFNKLIEKYREDSIKDSKYAEKMWLSMLKEHIDKYGKKYNLKIPKDISI